MKKVFFALWNWTKKPFIWIWHECRSWQTMLIFCLVFLVMSSEVWFFYLLGIIYNGTAFSLWCYSVASACWLFWIGPFTPFFSICIGLTFLIKRLVEVIKNKLSKKNNKIIMIEVKSASDIKRQQLISNIKFGQKHLPLAVHKKQIDL